MYKFFRTLVCAFLLVNICIAVAQNTSSDTPTPAPTTESEPATNEPSSEGETTENDGQYLVVNELGFGVGYPTYQLYHAYYSFQRDVWGVAFKGSYTASDGIYLGIAGRYYLPIGAPVPTFASLGAGITGNSGHATATFGAHIPFGLNTPARATIETGLAYTGNNGIQFVASLGVGYTFFVDTAPISPQERRRRELERLGNCTPEEITEPDESQLETAFDRALDEFLDRAEAQYAGSYSDLKYNIDINNIEVSGINAIIETDFSGSVTSKANGEKISTRGTITARFGWTGCSWELLDYDVET